VKNGKKPIANPFVVLREEFDDWAVLFDPDTGRGFGLNPTGVYIWKLLDWEHSLDGLLENMGHHAYNVPENVSDHVRAFVDELVAEGLAAHGDEGSYREKCFHPPLAGLNEIKPFTYEMPRLVNLSSGQEASGTTCSGHGSHGGSCYAGAGATVCCSTGTCGTNNPSCCSGSCGTTPSCCGGSCDTSNCSSGGATGCACSCSYGIQAGGCGSGTWPVSSCNLGNYTGQC
jgi:SynChlorMet cassette protein ScmD